MDKLVERVLLRYGHAEEWCLDFQAKVCVWMIAQKPLSTSVTFAMMLLYKKYVFESGETIIFEHIIPIGAFGNVQDSSISISV